MTFERLFIISFLTIMLSSFSCSEEEQEPCPDGINVTLSETDLDGCTWLLIDDEGNKYEAINLTTFDLQLEDGKELSVTYEEAEALSICMAGQIIDLTCLREL